MSLMAAFPPDEWGNPKCLQRYAFCLVIQNKSILFSLAISKNMFTKHPETGVYC